LCACMHAQGCTCMRVHTCDAYAHAYACVHARVPVHVKDGNRLHCCSYQRTPLLLMPRPTRWPLLCCYCCVPLCLCCPGPCNTFCIWLCCLPLYCLPLCCLLTCRPISRLEEVCNPKLVVPLGALRGGLGGFPGLACLNAIK